jgi:hypothetical protein
MAIKTVDLVEMGRTTDNGRKLLMDGPHARADPLPRYEGR